VREELDAHKDGRESFPCPERLTISIVELIAVIANQQAAVAKPLRSLDYSE
jgi:hypothetical protein